MGTSVYCIATSEPQAIRIANRLRSAGFTPDDISMLYPDRDGVRELATHNATKAPEGAAAGAGNRRSGAG